ncbi:MAG: choice-of-anchor D domain-containing protein [Betaproteobacteria bacterium]|nr:choice-of-anchor D domain-containing protein [Betaproteobacteria bacterium]
MSPQSKFRLTALAGALALVLSGEAAAQTTLTVNNSADAFTAGTLRQALSTVTNDCGCTGAPYTINFAFPGLTTIPVNSSLPTVPFPPACTVFIDGYSQPGSVPNSVATIQGGTNAQPRIILDGSSMTGGVGLTLDGTNSTVKGLVFKNFPSAALSLRGANSSALGNFFGVNETASGCASSQPNMVGVYVDFGSAGADVGGANPADRNVFGCMSKGIDVVGNDANIYGNLIGTGAGGAALPNGTGVAVTSSGFSPGVFVGAPSGGLGNLIARNTGAGVAVGSNRNSVYVQGNDIFLNGGLGIDLGNNGPTPNVASLFPSGAPNGGQNYPLITYVRYDSANTSVDFSFNGFANGSISVDVHANPPGLGLDEGARFVGSGAFPTDTAGNASGTVFLSGIQASPTLTATSSSGTSEFSPGASLDVSPKNLAFVGTVGNTSAPQVVTYTNISTSSNITIGPPITTGDFAATASGCDGSTSIPPGGTCTVSVTFTPIFLGNSFDFLDMPTSGTGGGRGIELAGLAQPNPVAAVSPPGPVNFGSQVVGTPGSPITFTLSNSGDFYYDVASVSVNGAQASSFTIVNNGCLNASVGTNPSLAPPPGPPRAAALPAVSTCDITVAMNPAVAGSLAATLDIQTNATNPVLQVALSGTGTSVVVPQGTVVASNPGPIDFGPRRVGTQSPTQTITLTNGGIGGYTVASATVRGTGFVKTGDSCTGVPLGTSVTSCAITLAFAPAFEGTYRTNLEILSNASNPQVLVELRGTGTPAPVGTLAAAPSFVSFGVQALGITTNPQTVEVTNTGTLPVAVSGVRVTGDFAQTNDCRALDSGQSCRAFVTFSPTAEGDRNGSLIVDSDASNRQLVVSLQGTGSPAPIPAIDLNPSAISFGTSLMGSGGGGTAVTLRNSGGANLALGRIYTIGDFRVSHSCPTNLPPGASCVATVSFTPSITGSRTGKLVVESNAPAGNKEASLSGTGCRNFGLGTSRLAAPICK